MAYHQRIDPAPQRARLTAANFNRLAEGGAFDGYARAELIEGEIWVVNAVHRWDARVQSVLNVELSLALRAIDTTLVVYSAGSVDMSEDSIPEPDLSIAEREGEIEEGLLPLARLRIAIEVSDSSLDFDFIRKALLYARNGVPEYWVVDRAGKRIVRHASPQPAGYLQTDSVSFGEPLSALTVSDLTIPTNGFVG
ncbi:MAG: Uma2 family endonuclease [Sphingomonadaceae bacterium]